MKRYTPLYIPLSVVTIYYALLTFSVWGVLEIYPDLARLLPVGGVETLLARQDPGFFEPVEADEWDAVETDGPITLALAMVATLLLMLPVSWVYVITFRQEKRFEGSFVQTIILLPILVTGIATIVQHSLALAFSLAGIVAAVRWRFTLDKPSHAVYIFAGIGVGLGAGISAVEISSVVSVFFVYTSLALWRLDYGDNLRGGFIAFFTGRDPDDEDL
ncbi:MAG: hypothetical protein O7G84_07880 [Gammaproteobacteria bacterium]|nr:hypothetical protein [Gammaproteobacteria bacterium]